jgi:hypothetical protein
MTKSTIIQLGSHNKTPTLIGSASQTEGYVINLTMHLFNLIFILGWYIIEGVTTDSKLEKQEDTSEGAIFYS